MSLIDPIWSVDPACPQRLRPKADIRKCRKRTIALIGGRFQRTRYSRGRERSALHRLSRLSALRGNKNASRSFKQERPPASKRRELSLDARQLRWSAAGLIFFLRNGVTPWKLYVTCLPSICPPAC